MNVHSVLLATGAGAFVLYVLWGLTSCGVHRDASQPSFPNNMPDIDAAGSAFGAIALIGYMMALWLAILLSAATLFRLAYGG